MRNDHHFTFLRMRSLATTPVILSSVFSSQNGSHKEMETKTKRKHSQPDLPGWYYLDICLKKSHTASPLYRSTNLEKHELPAIIIYLKKILSESGSAPEHCILLH